MRWYMDRLGGTMDGIQVVDRRQLGAPLTVDSSYWLVFHFWHVFMLFSQVILLIHI